MGKKISIMKNTLINYTNLFILLGLQSLYQLTLKHLYWSNCLYWIIEGDIKKMEKNTVK